MARNNADPTYCGARTQSGSVCDRAPEPGRRRCRIHGGANPKTKAAGARRLLEAMVGPALAQLRDIIDHPDTPPAVRLAAIRDILDRTGYKPPIQVEHLSRDSLEREYERLVAEYDS